jgi:parallel beta-helix repeat protein
MILFANLLFIESCIATGSTIYVDHNNIVGPWEGTEEFPFKDIQTGITAASAGDTVFVFNGTYNENIVITKNLTLIGENKDSTYINSGGNNHAVYVYGAYGDEIHIIIKNFTIQNAGGSGFDCIHLSYVTTGEISNNKVMIRQSGEGFSITNCNTLNIHNNIIMDTVIGDSVTGIYLISSLQNIIENNIIQNLQKGIQFASVSNNNQVINNTIRDNTVYGAYIVQSSSNIFTCNDFTANNQNAQDASSNTWDENNQGNYWDDYNNYDNNSDGIGDTPYSIPGGNNVDHYPLGYFIIPNPPGGENQPPVAVTLSISKSSAMYNETITFSGEGIDADGYIVGYQWRSSLDGVISTQQSFSKSTLTIGTHTIYFKVMDDDLAWSSEKTSTLTINSATNKPPTGYIDEITPNPAQEGMRVFFRGHGVDQDGLITAYRWLSSKDGILSTTASFSSTTLSQGTHTIYFQVKDSIEWSAQVTGTLVIEHNTSSGNPNNHAPVANVGGPYQGIVNKAITFNGLKSYDEVGSVSGYWDFGDKSNGTGLAPSHVYTAPGTYTVTLTVTDGDGQSSIASTLAVITLSSSQGDNPEEFSLFNVVIPYPVLLGIVLSIIGVICGCIFIIRRR